MGPPGPPPPPQIYIYIFFHILEFNFKSSFQIVSLFHMYIDMGGEMIAGEQDRLSLIIECPPPPGPLKLLNIYILAHI